MLIVVGRLMEPLLSGVDFEYVYFTPLARLVSLGEEGTGEDVVMHGCWVRGISSKLELAGLMLDGLYVYVFLQ